MIRWLMIVIILLEAVAVAPWLGLRGGACGAASAGARRRRRSTAPDGGSDGRLETMRLLVDIWRWSQPNRRQQIYPNIWRKWEKKGKCLTLRNMQKDRIGESANKAGNITTYDAHHPQRRDIFQNSSGALRLNNPALKGTCKQNALAMLLDLQSVQLLSWVCLKMGYAMV